MNEEELIKKTIRDVAEERESTLRVLEDLQLIEVRSIHLKRGFSSLHEFCVKVLHYSDGAAHRRISSMRLMKAVPEVREKIESGELTLTNAAKLQDFFRAEKTASPEKLQLIEKIGTYSRRELEIELVKRSPQAIRQEVIKPVNALKARIEFQLDRQQIKNIEKLQDLLSINKLEELFTLLINEKLAALSKKPPVSQKKPQNKISRFIPAQNAEKF